MGKIYDNWGMLVEAVQRRERDRELAMSHSRDHSIISDDGSSNRFSFGTTSNSMFYNQSTVHNFFGVDHYYHWDTTSPLDSTAMVRIEDEFRDVFSCHTTSPIEHIAELTSKTETISEEFFVILLERNNVREFRLIPPDAVYDFRCIAERMIAEGFLREYVQVFTAARKSFMEASLKQLDIEELIIGDIERLAWETMIRNWIKATKICVRVLFAAERRLCKNLFDGLENSNSADDVCFMEIVKGSAIQLFSFANVVSISEQSPERLFKILDLHYTLSELLPDIESMFDSKFGESVRMWVVEILSRLGEATRGIILEFEISVLRESSIALFPGGTVHPSTRYVMNYVSLIADYKLMLLELIVSTPSTVLSRYSSDPNVSDLDLSEFEGDGSTLALHLIWIMDILQFYLYGKSKHYKDVSLANLFMMNNIHYILQKIRLSPELSEIIGDDYLRSLSQKLGSAAIYYQRATLSRLLHCLRIEGVRVLVSNLSYDVSMIELKERFKSFNATFEEVRRTQAMWLIPDTQLREELRISIADKLGPAYRSFCGRFGHHVQNAMKPRKYIKYSYEDLEKSLFEDFFEGSPASRHLRKT